MTRSAESIPALPATTPWWRDSALRPGLILTGLLAAVVHGWTELIRPRLASRGIDVLGPAPPLVARIKNRHREQILIKGPLGQKDKEAALAAFHEVVGRLRGARAVDLRWDVDPESFF